MARPKKNYTPFNIKMDTALYERLSEYCEQKGQTKTTAVERILTEALNKYEKENSLPDHNQ